MVILMKKSKKIFLIIIIILSLISLYSNVYAINPDDYDPSKNPITTTDAKPILDKVSIVLGAIRNFSVVISVIALMIMGFKYIVGSVEEKANYKTTMIPYIIGFVMAVAGTSIVSFIYNAIH